MTLRVLAAVAVALLCGCEGIGYYVIRDPGTSQVLRVVSGDRLYMDLEENVTTGFMWDCVCDDSDVEVSIDHETGDSSDGRCGAPGVAKVRIRVHRGYDGPSTLCFRYRRQWEKGPPAREFTITLYKRTGDVAFWE